jgi:ATP-dependent protease HslVU (ClpYQ) peptidase subunit
MHIAGDLCVYTNHTTLIESLSKEVKHNVELSG